jgi:hypothetical protein
MNLCEGSGAREGVDESFLGINTLISAGKKVYNHIKTTSHSKVNKANESTLFCSKAKTHVPNREEVIQTNIKKNRDF